MMRATLWPTGLIGRVGLVLFAAVLLEFVGSTFFFEQGEVVTGAEVRMRRIAEQLETAGRVLGAADPAARPALTGALSIPNVALEWPSRGGESPAVTDDHAKSLRSTLLSFQPELAKRDLRLDRIVGQDDELGGTLHLADGSTLRFRIRSPRTLSASFYGELGSVVVLSGCVLLAALLVVRTLAAPLRMLVHATRAIGRGPPVMIEEKGPREIRRVARAFNAMQARIAKLLADRTQALAAVSHDLRTPIGRMRLRSAFLQGAEDRAAFEIDLDEMEAMLDELLAYLGGEVDSEKPRRTDIAATLATLVDAATDAGKEAAYEGPDHLVLEVRALAVKRALSNIINNALVYGDCAHVGAWLKGGVATVVIDDNGPGIPESEREAVFEPFHRLEASRNRATGGMGLGLAIARAAILREKGTIALSNRSEGGLRVTVTLPKDG